MFRPGTAAHAGGRGGSFRIVQEALSNVWRHANARKVSIDFHYLPKLVEVRIRDDGQGFVPTGQPGMGLINMRECALLIGAELTITSAPQHGCTVALSWPESGCTRVLRADPHLNR